MSGLRVAVLHLAADSCVLVFCMHHIISDIWSQSLLYWELGSLYEGHRINKPATLPELAVQYADYAVWQREHLSGDELDRQLDYWKQQLSGLPPLDFPCDYPRPAIRTSRGDMLPFSLSRELTDSVLDFSRR